MKNLFNLATVLALVAAIGVLVSQGFPEHYLAFCGVG